MSAFAGRSRASTINVSIQHDGGPDAGAHGDVEHFLITASGSPQRFRQPGSVGVVLNPDRHAISFAYLGTQRKISPAGEIRRVQHDSGLRVQRAGSADSDSL